MLVFGWIGIVRKLNKPAIGTFVSVNNNGKLMGSGVCIAMEKFWSLRDFLIVTVPFTMIGNLIINCL